MQPSSLNSWQMLNVTWVSKFVPQSLLFLLTTMIDNVLQLELQRNSLGCSMWSYCQSPWLRAWHTASVEKQGEFWSSIWELVHLTCLSFQ
mmetsp:Transcript_20642/g.49505  ORF Transcript_20642/g.49505 Transcript_20642/m.49505 type:complete len:90 (-) Transcript_20642:820-1089(-)